jgi:hypothetical protein
MQFTPRLAIRLKNLKLSVIFRIVLAWSLIFFLLAASGWCAPVDGAKARLVAQSIVTHHLSLNGDWNGSLAPWVGSGEAIQYQGCTVAYNFTIRPSGHVLVAIDDTLSPVPLYSTRSAFVPARTGHPQALETWIVPEQHGQVMGLDQSRRRAAGLQTVPSTVQERIARAWDFYTGSSTPANTARATARPTAGRSAVVGPLLGTRWGQGTPYNLFTPADTGCAHTLTGCVATAWAQVLNYWQWPDQGSGSQSYTWNGQTLSVDFSQSTYIYGAEQESIDIAQLIHDVGVAAKTDYGCTESSSEQWADDVLDIYFRYKAMTFHDRWDYADPNQWFALFQTELDAVPPRPVILSIFSSQIGHEVVVDGYQTEPTPMVHINFGWPELDDNYDGYYDLTNDFDAFYTWSAEEQYLVTGIEPNDSATFPTVNAGDDQAVDEGAAVTLTGSASHDGHTIQSYQWRRVDDVQFQITNADQTTATFTAPAVAADTVMVLRLKVVDEARNVSFDECTITVRDTSPAPSPPPASPSGDGGGGGGCFIGAL